MLYSCELGDTNQEQFELVKTDCQGKEACQIAVSREHFGDSGCPGLDDSEMHLWLVYSCEGGGTDRTKSNEPKCMRTGSCTCNGADPDTDINTEPGTCPCRGATTATANATSTVPGTAAAFAIATCTGTGPCTCTGTGTGTSEGTGNCTCNGTATAEPTAGSGGIATATATATATCTSALVAVPVGPFTATEPTLISNETGEIRTDETRPAPGEKQREKWKEKQDTNRKETRTALNLNEEATEKWKEKRS